MIIRVLLVTATLAHGLTAVAAQQTERSPKADAPRADAGRRGVFRGVAAAPLLKSPGASLPIGLRMPRLAIDSEEVPGQRVHSLLAIWPLV